MYILIRFLSGVILSFFIITVISSESAAQSKLRVGVYDSRAIAIACFNSNTYKDPMVELRNKMKNARDANDAKAIADIEREAVLRQGMGHEKGFGTGSVMTEIEIIKKELNELAKKEKLDLVLSKWELAFTGDNVLIIDITDKIARLFKPNEKVLGWLEELKKQNPVKEAYLIRD